MRSALGFIALCAAVSTSVVSSGCATVADLRDLDRKVVALDRRTQGPTDQQQRLAELGAEVSDLRSQLQELRGSIEELQHTISELRQAGPRPGAATGGNNLGNTGGAPGSGGPSSSAGPTGSGGQAGPGQPAAAQGRAQSENQPDQAAHDTAGDASDVESPPRGKQASGGQGKKDAGSEVRLYEEAYRTYRTGEYAAAIDRFRTFLQTYPSSDNADNALFWLGECYLQVGDRERAVLAFEDVVKKYPKGNKVPDALYRQGVALLELGAEKKQLEAYRSAAREIFERIVKEYPESERVTEARRQLERLGT